MKTNVLTLIITLVVGIILAGSLLMPVINGAIDANHETKYNNTGVKWHMVEADETVTASYDGTTCTINDNPIVFGHTYSFISADTFLCRWSATLVGARIYDYDNNTMISYNTWSLSASNGSATFTNLADTTQTTTVEYSWLFIPAETSTTPTGWVMTDGSGTYYLKEDSQIYISSTDEMIVIQGTLNDLKVTSRGEDASYVVNSTELDGYEEKVYKLTSIVVTGSNGTDYTFNKIIIPAEISLTKSGGSTIEALLLAIPVLVIISLIVMAAGAMYRRAD